MPSLSELQAQAASFEADIARAVADRVVPGVVLLAEDKTASFRYEKTLGYASLEPGAEVPVRPDSVFPLMSLSKLVTAVLCLQALKKGLVALDADVTPWLPELAAVPVLRGFDEATGAPQLEKRTVPITLRHLLTHSAGTTYHLFTPAIGRYRQWYRQQTADTLQALAKTAGLPGPPPPPPPPAAPPGQPAPPPPTVEAHCADPLLFQPGEGWQYGCSVDWAGRLLERVHGHGLILEDLVQRDVVAPLGLAPGSLTFYPTRYPDTVAARLWPSLPVRPALGAAVQHGPSPFVAAAASGQEGAGLGGEGLFAAMPAYAEILRSLLRDDGRLLRAGDPDSHSWLTAPQLPSPAARAQLQRACAHDAWITGNIPRDTAAEYDWSLAGLVVTGPAHPHRRPGTVTWSGALNLAWVVDRAAGVWALFGSSFLPFGDAQGNALMAAFEAHVYEATAKGHKL